MRQFHPPRDLFYVRTCRIIIGNASQEYIVNLEMVTEALEKCQYCDKGPLELANSCQDERPKGPIPILKVKCINSIRPAKMHHQYPPTIRPCQNASKCIRPAKMHQQYSPCQEPLNWQTGASDSWRNFQNRSRGLAYRNRPFTVLGFDVCPWSSLTDFAKLQETRTRS